MSGIGPLSPYGTNVAVTGSNTPIIGANSNRNGIIFINSSLVATYYLVPANLIAVVGVGIPLLPQGSYEILPKGPMMLSCGAAWNAIASGGTGNLLVLEFYAQ